ncbi:hypothetical protein HQ865_11705 [Mucilaginibacter mali]|uniref:Uncharacterized protein n=1 Tax=Mucilaginibacter mali TaxID=2740462 RepID=A0A7D4TP11_9SPHI|nr:hypothetical protein [Mucilaginibacter mali]QKJ30394.1 hypothetical protein HQ865_11705 [Mucilaginibacter mali]
MSVSAFKYFLVFAMFMFVAKPFVGYTLRYQHYFRKTHHRASILVKSFTKRKLEHNEDSEFSLAGIQKRLADPTLPSLLLFTAALAFILPAILNAGKNITSGFIAHIKLHLAQSQARYLLVGQLII